MLFQDLLKVINRKKFNDIMSIYIDHNEKKKMIELVNTLVKREPTKKKKGILYIKEEEIKDYTSLSGSCTIGGHEQFISHLFWDVVLALEVDVESTQKYGVEEFSFFILNEMKRTQKSEAIESLKKRSQRNILRKNGRKN